MEISLVVKNEIVKDMAYQCKSCVYCQASVSLLSRKIREKQINQIMTFISHGEKLFNDVKIGLDSEWNSFREILNKKNIKRKECLLLPLKTVQKALENK